MAGGGNIGINYRSFILWQITWIPSLKEAERNEKSQDVLFKLCENKKNNLGRLKKALRKRYLLKWSLKDE